MLEAAAFLGVALFGYAWLLAAKPPRAPRVRLRSRWVLGARERFGGLGR